MVTKELQKQYIKSVLATSPKAAIKALGIVFDNQTPLEQRVETTNRYNSIGFTGVDAKILTSFAKQYARLGRLSEKQMTILFKKMPKYWKQILDVTDIKKLNYLIESK